MKKNGNEPHAKDKKKTKLCPYLLAKRCQALTRQNKLCQGPAMKNSRCRMHGGKSTGPKTQEGLQKSKRSNWKHGFYSKSEKEKEQIMKQSMMKWLR